MKSWSRLLFPVIAFSLLSCGDLERLPTDPGGEEPPDPTATFARVQVEVFNPSCTFAGCHGSVAPQQQLTLTAGTAHANIVNRQSTESALLRVLPGSPAASYLYLKITGAPGITGDRMPQGLPPLADDKIRLVRDWIRRGAPND